MSEIENRSSTTDLVLVLDIDETCLHTLAVNENEEVALKTVESLNIYKDPKYMDLRERIIRVGLDDPVTAKGSGVRHACVSIMRPHLKEFLVFSFTYFRKVIIWSAGVKEYVLKLARLMARGLPENKKFDLVLTRNDCVLEEDGEYTKPLMKMVKEYPNLKLDISKMLVVDDRLSTFRNNSGSGILIPIYKPSVTISSMRSEDDSLLRLKNWCLTDEVKECTDVSTLDKTKIFTFNLRQRKMNRKGK